MSYEEKQSRQTWRGLGFVGLFVLVLTSACSSAGDVDAASEAPVPPGQTGLVGVPEVNPSEAPVPPGQTGLVGVPEVDPSEASAAPTYEAIRVVPVEEFPLVQAKCREEFGFPYTIGKRDGAYEYGPFSEEQWESFDAVSNQCLQQYPMEEQFAEDLSPEQLTALYQHQRDVWVPCMRGLGIDLGEPPTLETFLGNQDWVDPDLMIAEVDAAVQAGTIEHYNAWIQTCPDRPAELSGG